VTSFKIEQNMQNKALPVGYARTHTHTRTPSYTCKPLARAYSWSRTSDQIWHLLWEMETNEEATKYPSKRKNKAHKN